MLAILTVNTQAQNADLGSPLFRSFHIGWLRWLNGKASGVSRQVAGSESLPWPATLEKGEAIGTLKFLMENVPEAPVPLINGYAITSLKLNNRWVNGVQNRVRRFSFGVCGSVPVHLAAFLNVTVFEPQEYHPAILASGGARCH